MAMRSCLGCVVTPFIWALAIIGAFHVLALMGPDGERIFVQEAVRLVQTYGPQRAAANAPDPYYPYYPERKHNDR